jgi:hypothetical protein
MYMNVIKLIAVFGLFLSVAVCQQTLTVQGISGTGVTFSASDLAGLPQQTVKTADHGVPVTFQGVLLADVLSKVALPTGENFRSKEASYYLMVEAKDGYRTLFAWPELDATFMDKAVYVVTMRDGWPLSEKDGPFQLVVPGEKRNGRWVRQVKSLRVEPLPTATAYDSEQARWIAANLSELESIKVGMTRKDLLKVFMGEGGLSNRTWRRYVYRRCGYVKVDVEFAPVGDPSIFDEGPDDRITKISKPFLELAIMD